MASEKWLMSEQEWLECKTPWRMLNFLNKPVNDRKLRLFACACARNSLHLLSGDLHDAGLKALEKGEELADCLITPETAVVVKEKFQSFPGDFQFAAAAVSSALVIPHPDGWEDMRIVSSHTSLMAAAAIDGTDGQESPAHCELLRDIFGPLPFRVVELNSRWLTASVTTVAGSIYAERGFDRMVHLADALEGAGCTDKELLDHCRSYRGPHASGCWIIDLILGRE